MKGVESFETVAGCRTRMMRGGSGEPLLFLHGARGAGVWLPFMEKLSDRFDLIVPEHPGFGGSDTPDWLDNVGDVAFFYLDFIRQLGLKDVHLVGTSIGGWIAAEIAVRSTHDLKTLVLSCPAGLHVSGVRKGDVFLWSPEQLTRNLFHDQALAENALKHEPTEAQLSAEMKNQLTVAKLAWQPRLHNPHLAKWLHRIDVPTLLLWGDDDRIIPAGHAPAFQAGIPGATLRIIEGSGHLPQVEKADEWVGEIATFAKGAGR